MLDYKQNYGFESFLDCPTRTIGLFLGATSMALSLASHAAPLVPNAGEILKTVPSPTPSPPASTGTSPVPSPPAAERRPFRGDRQQRITVKRITITGNTLFPEDELQALVQDAIGQTLPLKALNDLANRLAVYYQNHGYLLARAYIPAQDVTGGTLEIAVLEGHYGRIHLDNHSGVSDDALMPLLRPLQRDEPVEAGPLERQLLLMSDLPGAAISSTLLPGDSTGTSDLFVEADSTPALTGTAGIDNWGNHYTGALRPSASMDWASPLGLGDRMSLYGMGSQRDGTRFGRAAYDLPADDDGMRVGAAYAYLDYALGLGFAALGAHGTAEITSLYASYPLTRSRFDNSTLLLDMDHRRLRDYVDSTAGSDLKLADVATFGANGDHRSQQGGATLWNAGISAGHLKLDPASAMADLSGYHTAGTYLKLDGGGSQSLPLAGLWSLYGALSGQLASRNLDVSEKFSMGGPTGVRAYPVGEAMADDAWLGTLELRLALTESLQLAGFADGGLARINHTPLPTDTGNQRSLSGLGLGAAWKDRSKLSLLAYFAWRTGDPALSAPERRPTVWVQAMQGF